MSISQSLRQAIYPRNSSYLHQQCRHASLLRRPKRPYTFTQLVTLSDGSTYTHRTTSPTPVYNSAKDTRNSPLWNTSSQKLLNVEDDEAGRLRAFRNRFGRGWDAKIPEEGDELRDGEEETAETDESLLDLITGYAQQAEPKGTAKGVKESKGKSGSRKGGER